MSDRFNRAEIGALLAKFQKDACLTKREEDLKRSPGLSGDSQQEVQKERLPKIAVIGDYCLDKYLYRLTELDEVSVETGLVAWQIREKKLFAGVGGTITSNLQALGAQTYCFGIRGDDGEGYDLHKALLSGGANIDGMVVSDQIVTGTYMKPMRREGNDWIEMNRLDIRNAGEIPAEVTREVCCRFEEKIPEFDVVIVTDQFPPDSGSIFSSELRNWLSNIAAEHKETFFFCDSRFFVEDYRNMMVKCNANEMLDFYAGSIGRKQKATTLGNNAESKTDLLREAGSFLMKRNGCPVLVTRGEQGSLLFQSEGEKTLVTEIPAVKVEPPIDICGAGDATNAGMAFAHALGLDLAQSALLAGIVSSITIRQIGVTGTASVSEIIKVLSQGDKNE